MTLRKHLEKALGRRKIDARKRAARKVKGILGRRVGWRRFSEVQILARDDNGAITGRRVAWRADIDEYSLLVVRLSSGLEVHAAPRGMTLPTLEEGCRWFRGPSGWCWIEELADLADVPVGGSNE